MPFVLKWSFQNIRNVLFTGNALNLSLIFRLLAVVEIFCMVVCLDMHVVVQFHDLLVTDIVHLEQTISPQFRQRVLGSQSGRGHLGRLINRVLISCVDYFSILYLPQIAEIFVLLQLEHPRHRQLPLLTHQLEVIVKTIPKLFFVWTAKKGMHLVVSHSIYF